MTETFTSILDAAMASAIAAAEARGYQQGRKDALGEPSMAAVDRASLNRLATSLRDIMGKVDEVSLALDEGDILDGIEVDADAIEVPADDCGLSEIAEWLGEHGGKTLIDHGDAAVDCDSAREAMAAQAAKLQAIRDALCALIDRL
jgi:hypothetical protein